jgi:hypothetical protein
MRAVRMVLRVIAIVAIVAGTAFSGSAAHSQAGDICGKKSADDPDGVRAVVKAPRAGRDVVLGRKDVGVRRTELDFVFSGCVPPTKVPVTIGIFKGGDDDLARNAIALEPTKVSGQIVRVTLRVGRTKVPAGSFSGPIRVGTHRIGEAAATLTIKRQEPMVPWPLAVGIVSGLGGVMIAGSRRLYEKPTELRSKTNGESAFKAKKTGRWAGWYLLRPFEWVLKWFGNALKGATSRSNFWPILVGIGAGAATWSASYVNDGAWNFGLEGVWTLGLKIGAAAFVAAFAAWQATPRPQTGS